MTGPQSGVGVLVGSDEGEGDGSGAGAGEGMAVTHCVLNLSIFNQAWRSTQVGKSALNSRSS